MPLLGLGKQRLDPDLALADRLLVRLGRVVAAHALEVLGMEGTMHDASVVAGGASRLDWAGIAGSGSAPVNDDFLAILGRLPLEGMVSRAAVFISLSVICEIRLDIDPRSPGS